MSYLCNIKIKNELNMKTENKTNDTFEFEDIITLIALIGAVITIIFSFTHLGFNVNLGAYILGTVGLYLAYRIGLYLLVGIIGLLIAFIMCLFIKNNKESD